MKMMRYAETQGEDFCVAWMEDGKSFIIRKPDDFTRTVVPKFFKPTKFSSFTRKLYRWGFRQVNRGIGPDDPIIFGNEHFQKENPEQLSKMRSVTAASTRKQEMRNNASYMYGAGGYTGMKHPLDGGHFDEQAHKRMMVDQIYQQKLQNPYGGGGGGRNMGGPLSLTSALRPNMFPSPNGGGMMNHPGAGYHHHHHHHQGGGGQGGGMNMNMNMNSYDAMAPLPVHQYMPGSAGGGGHGHQGGGGPMSSGHQGGSSRNYPNPQSTAEIVNAAIQALRYAN